MAGSNVPEGGTAYAQGIRPPDQPTFGRFLPSGITVVGTGEVQRAPDQARITLGVQAQAQTARQALNQVSTAANDVIAALRQLGIQDRQIQTTSVDLHPIHESPRPPRPGQVMEEPQGPPPIVGYRANNQVRVTVNNLGQLGAVIDSAISAGANVVSGIQFTLENDASARQEALRMAVQEARSEAEVLATALGLRITGIQSVIEDVGFSPPGPGPVFAMEARGGAAPPVQAGELTVRKRVQIVFDTAA
ncbi:MAG TPA: SIMPL domain-containing protein [Chloroflexota bacterium]|nr:SIMPL domain-containing protein [Chloroflexota bacterium]